MSHNPDLPGLLRRQGLRVTPQRLLIVDILQHSSRHLSADEIFDQIQERFRATDISTVYRTLDVLTGLGLVQKVTLGETHDHFEWVTEPHHHVVCRRCGTVQQLGDEVLAPLRTALDAEHGFTVERASVEVFGLCSPCRELGSDAPPVPGMPSHEH